MKIWIDADACPKSVKNILYKTAMSRKVEIFFVANSWLFIPTSDYIHFILVDQGPDIADNKITEDCCDGDLVITADVPLAARIVAKGAIGLDPRGRIYNKNNIGAISDIRNFMHNLRNDGIVTVGPNSYSNRDSGKFANELDKVLVKNNLKKINYD